MHTQMTPHSVNSVIFQNPLEQAHSMYTRTYVHSRPKVWNRQVFQATRFSRILQSTINWKFQQHTRYRTHLNVVNVMITLSTINIEMNESSSNPTKLKTWLQTFHRRCTANRRYQREFTRIFANTPERSKRTTFAQSARGHKRDATARKLRGEFTPGGGSLHGYRPLGSVPKFAETFVSLANSGVDDRTTCEVFQRRRRINE